MNNFYGKQRLYAWLMKGLILHLFLFFSFFSVAGVFSSAGQGILKSKISLHVEGMKIKGILRKIEEEGTARFAYQPMQLDVDRTVSLSIEDSPLENVLTMLFDNDVLFEERGDLVVIKSAIVGGMESILVSGKVVDETGTPMPGVNVQEKETTNGTITDAEGAYAISVENSASVLIYSFMGYETQEEVIKSKSVIDIRLVPAQTKLNEVVVVGYGEQKKSSLTGAVGSVSSKEIQKLVVSNVGTAIQGRTPGVTVNTDGGVAGGAVNILVRGASSLTNVSPLFVIDGAFANNLSGVSMNDVESIEVLKDAAAAAIYGSRAANGVVLVTTKKGKSGSVQINMNTSYSLQTPSKYLSFVNAQEYAKMITEAAGREGRSVPVRVSNLNPSIDEDYQRLWFGNAGMYNLGLDASGGQKNSTFFTSFNYFNQKSILAFSDFKRYDFRLNNTIKRDKFKIEEYFSANRTENKPNYAYSGSAYGFDIPILPARNPHEALWGVNSDGYASGLLSEYYMANPPSSPNPNFTTNNMLATGALSKFQENANILTGGIKASYELLKGLTYSFGLNGYYHAGHTVYDIAAYTLLDIDGKNPAVQNRNFTESNSQYFQYTMDNLFSYKINYKKHELDALAGQSWLSEHSRIINNIAGPTNFVSNTVTVPQGAIATSGFEYGSGLLSFFGRVNYSFDDRYLLSLSVRRDASSKFAKDNRVGLFPSVSAGWNIHNEHFFKSKFISLAKLRAGYGELGANFIPPYSYISTIRSTVPATLGDQSRSLGTLTELANPNLKWETSRTVNMGLTSDF